MASPAAATPGGHPGHEEDETRVGASPGSAGSSRVRGGADCFFDPRLGGGARGGAQRHGRPPRRANSRAAGPAGAREYRVHRPSSLAVGGLSGSRTAIFVRRAPPHPQTDRSGRTHRFRQRRVRVQGRQPRSLVWSGQPAPSGLGQRQVPRLTALGDHIRFVGPPAAGGHIRGQSHRGASVGSGSRHLQHH